MPQLECDASVTEAIADVENWKKTEFWSLWAAEDDFAKIAKKKWDPAFLRKVATEQLPSVQNCVTDLNKQTKALQGMKANRPS